MPNVRGGNVRGVGQSKQGSYHTREQVAKTNGPSRPRDDIAGAFAGDENESLMRAEHKEHSTSVKSRDRKAMEDKTPKR